METGKILIFILCALIGYIIGSTTLAILIGDVWFNRDVRNEGSGNMGATNVTRSFGLEAGICTLLWDMGKCVLALIIGRKLGGSTGLSLAGAGCVIGHAFPCFHGFKGGKCVAVGAIIGFAVSPKVFLIIVGVFVLIVLAGKRISLASITAAAALSISSAFLAQNTSIKILGVATGIIIIILHRQNIKRLIRGEEPRFKFTK